MCIRDRAQTHTQRPKDKVKFEIAHRAAAEETRKGIKGTEHIVEYWKHVLSLVDLRKIRLTAHAAISAELPERLDQFDE